LDSTLPPSDQPEIGEGKQPGLPKPRRLFWLVLSLLIASILLYFSLRNLDWSTFWKTVSHGHYGIIWLLLPITSFNYFLRAFRWSLLISSDRKIPILSVFWANMVGYLGNAYLPARTGEILRSAFLGEKSGLGTSFVLATALVERFLDVITLVIVGSITLALQGNIPPTLMKAIGIMAFLGFAGLAFILVLPLHEDRILRWMDRLPWPEKISRFLDHQIRRFLSGAHSLQNRRRLAGFMMMTGLIWLIDALLVTLGVRIISQTLRIDQALVLLAALGLSSAIPSTPGYVGVYQFVALLVLVPFGFSQSEALAYILISQVLGYLVISFWGLIGLWQINRMKKIMPQGV
jgi:glycosyltransferase 2 family protein